MRMQVLIIGLGQFGMSLAKTLSDKGVEVIGADIDKEIVDEASAFLEDVICLDATDEISLAKLCPKERDIVICAIGSREASILTTALLKQMGCENVISRATEKIHERILKAVGAKNVINPDEEYGKKYAYKILFHNVITDVSSDDIQLLEISVQPFMSGKNLIELALPNKYGIIVAAIRKGNKLTRPFPSEKLSSEDSLLLVCTDESLEKMFKDNVSERFNLGSGNGFSVAELVKEAKRITGIDFKVEVAPRRAGDPAVLVADSAKAQRVLGWKPEYNLTRIIETAWNWEQHRKF